MSMDVHFLAGSWHVGGNGCLCMLSDVTRNARRPLQYSGFRGFETRVWSFDSPRPSVDVQPLELDVHRNRGPRKYRDLRDLR